MRDAGGIGEAVFPRASGDASDAACEAETSAFYFGPTLHYGSERWWATLAVYQQLPWAGNPADDVGAISHGLLVEAERYRVRFRLGVRL